jgi:GNAT superfamily N-acetyltransferase
MPSPSIAPLDYERLDVAVALFDAQLREHGICSGTNLLSQAVRQVVEDHRYGFILIADFPDGNPVGVAYASSLLSLEHGGVSGWLEEPYVLPELRGNGIGSRLLEEVIARAQQLGWKALDLEVDFNHERAISLYERYLFQPHSRRRFYRLFYNAL